MELCFYSGSSAHFCIGGARLEGGEPGGADAALAPPVRCLIVDDGRGDVRGAGVRAGGGCDGEIARLEARHRLQQPLQRRPRSLKVLQRLQRRTAYQQCKPQPPSQRSHLNSTAADRQLYSHLDKTLLISPGME